MSNQLADFIQECKNDWNTQPKKTVASAINSNVSKAMYGLELLQKRYEELENRATPMKPIIEIISAGTCGMTYANYQCPNCKHGSIMVGNYKDKVDYCHDCGQAIDWSEVK